MQEYALFGLVPSESHRQVLHQLAGVSRMQPQAVEELRLIFKAKPPPGLADVQKSSGGGSQGVVPPEVQKTRSMLNASLYYIQLVGTVQAKSQRNSTDDASGDVSASGDVLMADEDGQEDVKQLNWTLEFRDTPDPGKQPVSSRLLYKTPIVDGDIVKFIEDFGFEYVLFASIVANERLTKNNRYVSRYVVNGHKVYDQDTTLFLHRIMTVSADVLKTGVGTMPKNTSLSPLDKSEGYILSATIETLDGSNAELRERAARQLLTMKDTMKGAVNLTPGDRLALDTKVPVGPRR
jgi:mediator of RNA polymerase II transcription subunit 18, fungi type